MWRFVLALLIFPCIFTIVSAQDNELRRHPSVDEVARYLRSHLDAPPAGFINYFWLDDESLYFADVDGDGDEDLVAHGWLFVAVILWDEDAYLPPFQIIETASTDSGDWSHIFLEDWTMDGIVDVVFERRHMINGLGAEGSRYYRRIISCTLLCAVAWEGVISDFLAFEAEQGMYLAQREMNLSRNNDGRIILDVIRRDFAFNCTNPLCTVQGEVIDLDQFQARSRIGATIRTRYLWDGIEFLYQDTVTLIDSHIMPSQSQLVASHENEKVARIDYSNMCNLLLDDLAIMTAFPCVVDFTRIYWIDELLVLEYAYFRDEILIIFDLAGNELQRITGAIRDETLFGVQIENQQIISSGHRYDSSCDYHHCWFGLAESLVISPLVRHR